MATIINTPSTGTNDNSGLGIVLGIVVAFILLAVFFVYALPALRGDGAEPTTNVIKVELPKTVTPEPTTPAN